MSAQLSRADIESPLWRAIEAHLLERLKTLRARNDASAPIEKTEHLRGQIHEVKALLALAEQRPMLTD